MNLAKNITFCLIFLLSTSIFAETNDRYLIQFGEKYLTLEESCNQKKFTA